MFNATPFLRIYAAFRSGQLAAMNPGVTQTNQLLGLLQKAKDTKFGKDYSFSTISSVEEYQKRVPLRTYEKFWNEYWKDSFPKFQGTTWPDKVKYIPVSSGTTSGTTKWIPCTDQMVKSNTKAGLDLLVHHVTNRKDSQIFGGKSFILGGSTDLVEQAPGIFSGDLSGIAVKTLPFWAKARYFPPAELALLKNWEEKIAILSERSLTEHIRMFSGVPSWMLIFFDALFKKFPNSDGKLKNIYPELEMIVHGGVNFSPYYERFKKLLDGSHAELREVYPASEGFIAVADRGYGEGMRVNLDNGIFYEFVPLEELTSDNPTRHWIGNIQKDINYAVVLTTCAGLWSYVIGDTVRFVETNPPRLLVTGRTSYYLSAFGEHVIAEEVEDGISYACKELSLTVTDYSVGAVYPAKEGELGGHRYVVEFAGSIPTAELLQKFSHLVDERISKRNEDYEAHRAKNFGLNPPQIIPVQTGFFAEWMKKRGKLGGQNKVPRIISKKELFDDLSQSAGV